MDERETYGSARLGQLVQLYFPPALVPPESVMMRLASGEDVEFVRLAARSLHCDDVAGVTGHCGSYECHRRQLGVCQCGRHDPAPRPERPQPATPARTSTDRQQRVVG